MNASYLTYLGSSLTRLGRRFAQLHLPMRLRRHSQELIYWIVREQHRGAIIGEVESVVIGELQGIATCAVSVGVKNLGTPTIVKGWRLTAYKNGRRFECDIFAIPETLTLNIENPGVGAVVLKRKD